MGIAVLILGESGSGKSASMRNIPAEAVGVFNVAAKPLPFRSDIKPLNKRLSPQNRVENAPIDYQTITRKIEQNKKRVYVVDDSQYLLAFEFFNKSKEKGYEKFTAIAVNFYELIKSAIDNTDDDTTIYFLHHTETVADTGKVKAKTIGKMLDEKLTLEGLFPIVLFCKTDGKEHWFETQSDGFTTAKSPMDMLPFKIDNDLWAVDKAIREYWGLKPAIDKPDDKPEAEQQTTETATATENTEN